MLVSAAAAHCVGSTVVFAYYPKARGLALGYTPTPTAWAQLLFSPTTPRLADSPWATRRRPLRGLNCCFRLLPQGSRTRLGLPAAARCVGSSLFSPATQGSRTRLGLHAAAHCVDSSLFSHATPRLADSPWATRRRPLRGLNCCFRM